MHDPPRQQEQHKQDGKGVEEADLAEHIKSKKAEDRRHLDALQPIGAAGDVGKALGQRLQQQRDPQRHHQAGQVDTPDHQEAGEEADRHGGETRDHQRRQGLRDDAVQREQPGAIGADAEEGRVAERNDTGIAEDQIERQREQREPHDVGHDQKAGGKQERAGERQNPERNLAPVPARVLLGVTSDVGLRGHGGLNGRRCGRTGRSDARSGSRS
ncbi:hypothetical protein GALL_529160 [mine drainage metagenome]|uniref:Uncharacterized protein n=1 Tax=mine drainage metagenome TaxID=410659 RepID=A0A1J5PPP2_9ZZZZ